MVNQVRLFVSHSWRYGSHYDGLKQLLVNRPYFSFVDYSIPRDRGYPLGTPDKELALAIDERIRLCRVVLILAGVYATYSSWIQVEVDVANKYAKPILAVKPRQNTQVSSFVMQRADGFANWNTESIVREIRRLAAF